MTNENKKKRPRQQGKYARKGSKWRKFLHKANVFATKAIKKTGDAAAFMVNKNDVKYISITNYADILYLFCN